MSRYIFTVYLNKKRKKRNFACMLLTNLSIFAPNNFRYLRSNGNLRGKKSMILTKETLSAGPKIGTGEGVAHSKRWYVALVRMHHEKKVAERLDKMGIENFVPVQQEVHQWSDRRKVVESVLLPMMVFVHADPKERKEVLSFSTVSRYMVMRGESSPTIIPDEQMARFRFMLDYSEEAICMNSSPLARGEKVRVVKGPLTGLVGELVNVDGKSKIAVRLNMLGCACVNMPIGYVEAVCEKN